MWAVITVVQYVLFVGQYVLYNSNFVFLWPKRRRGDTQPSTTRVPDAKYWRHRLDPLADGPPTLKSVRIRPQRSWRVYRGNSPGIFVDGWRIYVCASVHSMAVNQSHSCEISSLTLRYIGSGEAILFSVCSEVNKRAIDDVRHDLQSWVYRPNEN